MTIGYYPRWNAKEIEREGGKFWEGTSSVWRAADFNTTGRYLINYSVMDTDSKTQNITFAESYDPGLQNLGGRIGFPPPEKKELVLSIEMGCIDTVHFSTGTKHPVLSRPIAYI